MCLTNVTAHWVCEACAVDMQERVGQGNNFECPFCRRIVMAYSRNLIATQILQQLQRRHQEGQVLSKQMEAQVRRNSIHSFAAFTDPCAEGDS